VLPIWVVPLLPYTLKVTVPLFTVVPADTIALRVTFWLLWLKVALASLAVVVVVITLLTVKLAAFESFVLS